MKDFDAVVPNAEHRRPDPNTATANKDKAKSEAPAAIQETPKEETKAPAELADEARLKAIQDELDTRMNAAKLLHDKMIKELGQVEITKHRSSFLF